jgi:hypothetical protein
MGNGGSKRELRARVAELIWARGKVEEMARLSSCLLTW